MLNSKDLGRYTNLVGSIRIDHRAYDDIHRNIEEAYEEAVAASESSIEVAAPICLLIVGETRTGKSSVARDFFEARKSAREKQGLRQAVLYATAPPEGTVKALLEQLLRALGDPHWSKGSRANMTHRLLTLLKGVGCRMIILDEFQHLCDKGQRRRLVEASDWLKNLVECKEWALVAVGLPECLSVINANRQLKARFDSPLTMPLFDWCDGASRRQFRAILKAFAKELAPFELPCLDSDDVAFRVFLATSGRLGLFAKLMDRAVKTAIRAGTTKIRLEDLAEAFTRSIWFSSEFPLDGGPFMANLDVLRVDEIVKKVATIAERDEFVDTSAAVEIHGASSEQGNNRLRGQPSKRRHRDQMARAL